MRRLNNLQPIIISLLVAYVLPGCATARPDPERISDEKHVFVELQSKVSLLKVQVLEANLHQDLKFFPDTHALYYRVLHKNSQILQWSPLGLKAEGLDFTANVQLGKFTSQLIRHKYTLAHGKQREIEKEAEKFVAEISNTENQKLTLEFILQKDAVAFRYVLPASANLPATVKIEKEQSGYRLPPESIGYLQQHQEASQVSPAYEYYYEKTKAGASDSGKASIRKMWQPVVGFTGLYIFGSDGWAFPALFKIPDQNYLLITEAGTDENYAAMHMTPSPDYNLYTLEFPSEKEANGLGSAYPQSSLPLVTPYRVVICCDLASITQSTAVTDFAQPLDARFKGKIPPWVAPGKSTWDWLSYLSTGDVQRQKRYIDAAHEFGWQYTLIDANWNKWNNNNPEPLIKELVMYAAEKKIGLWLWYNSGGPNNNVTEEPRDLMTDPAIRRKEFAKLKEWGIKGVKIDFWSSDKQTTMRQYIETLADAADYQIMVNFHGSTMPRGWQRRFPNLMTMESVKGAEWYQFPVFRGPNAQDNVFYSYTRNVAGPMDYTPIVFEQALKQQKITYAHSLALSVVFESGVQHFADNADNGQKGYRKIFALFPFAREFLREVPVSWDETVFLNGSPESHVILARVKNGIWYIGGISSSDKEINLKQKLTFPVYGKYAWQMIAEGDSADTLKISSGETHTAAELDFRLSPKGGFLLKLVPLPEKGK